MNYPGFLLQGLQSIRVLPGTTKVTCISFNTDGSRVAVGCSNGKLLIFLVDTLHQLTSRNSLDSSVDPLQTLLMYEKEVKCISWSHLNPRRIAVGYIDEPRILICSVTTQQELSILNTSAQVRLTLLRRDSNPLFKFSTHAVLHVHHRLMRCDQKQPKSHTCMNCEDVLAGCANGYITCWSLPSASAERERTDHSTLDPVWKVRADAASTRGTPIVSLEHVKSTYSLTGATVSYVVMAASADGLLTFWEALPSSVDSRKNISAGKNMAPQCLRRVDTSIDLIGATVLLYGQYSCESCTIRAEKLDKKSRKVRDVEQRCQTIVTHSVWPDVLVTGRTGQMIVYFNLDSATWDLNCNRRCVSPGTGETSLPATLAVGDPSVSSYAWLAAREKYDATKRSSVSSKFIVLPLTHNGLLAYSARSHPLDTHLDNPFDDMHTSSNTYNNNSNNNTNSYNNDISQLLGTRQAPGTQFTALAAHPSLPLAVAGARGQGILLLDLRHRHSRDAGSKDSTCMETSERKPFQRVNCSVNVPPLSNDGSATAMTGDAVFTNNLFLRRFTTPTIIPEHGLVVHAQSHTEVHRAPTMSASMHNTFVSDGADSGPVGSLLSQQSNRPSLPIESHLYDLHAQESVLPVSSAKQSGSGRMDEFVVRSIYKQTKQSNRKKRYRDLFERDEIVRISNHS